MRTPAHAPSARLSRAAGPMPPRSSARRVLRPLPTPRNRRGEAMAERHSAIDTTGPPFEGHHGSAGAPSVWEWRAFRGPPSSATAIEARHGFCRGATSAGGFRGLLRGPHHLRRLSRRATAFAGARRALGGLGGHVGAPIICDGYRGAPRLSPGRDERWGVWGAMSGPPISIDTTGPPCENGPNSPTVPAQEN